MPPFIKDNSLMHNFENGIVLVYETESEASYEESEDELPEPVSEMFPFEFHRVRDILEATLEFCDGIGSINLWEDDNGLSHYEVQYRVASLRKTISSKGDIEFDHQFWSSDDRHVYSYYCGAESGVCDHCKDLSATPHPLWYKMSERYCPALSFFEKRPEYIEGLDEVLVDVKDDCMCYIRALKRVCVYMQHGNFLRSGSLKYEFVRQEMLDMVLCGIRDESMMHMTEILAFSELPSTIKNMKLK